jgi:cytochrome P450
MDRWPSDRPFPLLPRLRDLTFDVILRVVFGLEDPSRLERLRSALAALLRMGRSWMILPWVQQDLGPLSPWGRFLRARDRVDQLLLDEIRMRRGAPLNEDGGVIEMLAGSLSEQELKDELMTLLVAGHETTASSLAWCFDEMLRHPNLVNRLVAEREAGSTHLLDAVIKETLRLRSVFRLVSRRLRAPLELDRYAIPAGIAVGANLYRIHRRPDLYPDPLAFRPERFTDASQRAWIPFGGGARRCLGASFALYEMSTIVGTVVDHADLRPASPRPETVRLRAVMMVPRRGTRVVMTARR